MRIYEVEGSTPQEIIALFSQQQDIPKDYLEYEVIDAGKSGVLGFGKRNAKIKIKYNELEHIKRKSRILLTDMLEKAAFPDIHVEATHKGERIILNIRTTDDRDLLIGKSGQTLDAMQYLIEKMIDLDNSTPMEIIVDVDGYKEKKIEQNIAKALKFAEQVKSSGKPMKLEPLPASMRKSVHIALKSVKGITTLSTGLGHLKQINIVPDNKK